MHIDIADAIAITIPKGQRRYDLSRGRGRSLDRPPNAHIWGRRHNLQTTYMYIPSLFADRPMRSLAHWLLQ